LSDWQLSHLLMYDFGVCPLTDNVSAHRLACLLDANNVHVVAHCQNGKDCTGFWMASFMKGEVPFPERINCLTAGL